MITQQQWEEQQYVLALELGLKYEQKMRRGPMIAMYECKLEAYQDYKDMNRVQLEQELVRLEEITDSELDSEALLNEVNWRFDLIYTIWGPFYS